ncbi:MAG: glycoside hydrolase family 78 protein [Puniceicoccales bacterium]|jgi:hypothetical protein|nr:glycoside hydrolase family 78 protein [Puniceicoccales bacterium]
MSFSLRKLCCGLLALLASGNYAAAQLTPENLRCEHLTEPIGVDATQPLLSWTLTAADASARNQRQAAYQVLVASSRKALDADKGDIWDSGRTASDAQSALLPTRFAPTSGTTYHWKARSWDQDGRVSPWSRATSWTTGVFKTADWKNARWIGISDRGRNRNAPWYRKTFTLDAAPGRTLVHLASFGFHELYVNGKPASDSVLNSAVTDLTRRVLYRTYDITPLLQTGKNVIAVWLGHGWTDWDNWQDKYGRNRPADAPRQGGSEWAYSRRGITHGPAFLVALIPAKGNPVISDDTWKTAPSPNTVLGRWSIFNFGGEHYDARADDPNWNTVGFDDSAWAPASFVRVEPAELNAESIHPNRAQRTIRGLSVKEFVEPPKKNAPPPKPTTAKKWRVDMGEDIVGFFRVPLTGKAGQVIEITYADKELQENSQSQLDRVTLSGKNDVFENRFNYRTGRWLTFKGLDAPPDPATITGKLIRTDYPSASEFSSSDNNLNKINAIARHTYECVSLGGQVVDCPHRERCGYGAEGQADMECALFQFDQAAFNRKWLVDWADSADPDTGRIPYTAPTKWGGGGPAWQMIVATLPWETYLHTGDKRILAENYATMVNYLNWVNARVRDDILGVYHVSSYNYLGDWMAYGVPETIATRQFFSNCFLIHALQNAAKVADALGHTADAATYTARANRMKVAVHKRFYNAEKGYYVQREQTYLAFPLLIGLPPADVRPIIEKALAENIIVTRKGHISSGVLGTYTQLKYLTEAGRHDLIHLMTTQEDAPGWLFFFKEGLTAIPEIWNGFQTNCSSTHSSFNSIGAWFINGLAGIQPAAPGFARIRIAPGATDKVEWVKATHRSIRGPVTSEWRNKNGILELSVTIPPNATAEVVLPVAAGKIGAVKESGKPLANAVGVLGVNGNTVSIGSGRYVFEVPVK